MEGLWYKWYPRVLNGSSGPGAIRALSIDRMFHKFFDVQRTKPMALRGVHLQRFPWRWGLRLFWEGWLMELKALFSSSLMFLHWPLCFCFFNNFCIFRCSRTNGTALWPADDHGCITAKACCPTVLLPLQRLPEPSRRLMTICVERSCFGVAFYGWRSGGVFLMSLRVLMGFDMTHFHLSIASISQTFSDSGLDSSNKFGEKNSFALSPANPWPFQGTWHARADLQWGGRTNRVALHSSFLLKYLKIFYPYTIPL